MNIPIIKKSNTTINGNPVVTLTFKGKYKFNDIRNIAYNYFTTYKDKNFHGVMTINALFPTKSGKNSKWRALSSFRDI